MFKKEWTCRVLSPMFTYGYLNPELRPTEVKALMRYLYRISYLEPCSQKLYETESNLFGDAEKHASPFRIQMRMNNSRNIKQPLLLHKDVGKGNPPIANYSMDTSFQIIFRAQSEQEINRAEEALILSLLLGGIGKRSRRGRGCVVLENERIPKNELLPTIAKRLNQWNEHLAEPPYIVDGDEIRNNHDLTEFNRPVIEWIRLGREFKSITDFLESVDNASHEIKKSEEYSRDGLYATGFARKNMRFASSLIVSMTQTSEGALVPIYTSVLAKYKGNTLDMEHKERNDFIHLIEKEV